MAGAALREPPPQREDPRPKPLTLYRYHFTLDI
jgi:hypothetical protein